MFSKSVSHVPKPNMLIWIHTCGSPYPSRTQVNLFHVRGTRLRPTSNLACHVLLKFNCKHWSRNFQKLKLPFPHHVFFFSFLPAFPFLFSFPLPVPCLSFPVLLLTHHSSHLDRQPPKRKQDQSVASEKRNERDRAIFSVSKWQNDNIYGQVEASEIYKWVWFSVL